MLKTLRNILINKYLTSNVRFLFPQTCQRNSGWESLDTVLSPILFCLSLYETHGYQQSIIRQFEILELPYGRQEKGQSPSRFAFQALADILKTSVKVYVVPLDKLASQ